MLFNNRSEFLDRFLTEDSAKVAEKHQELNPAPQLSAQGIGLEIQSLDRCLEYVLR